MSLLTEAQIFKLIAYNTSPAVRMATNGDDLKALIAATEAAVLEAQKQEPVGEVTSDHTAGMYDEFPIGTKLYAAPVVQPVARACDFCGAPTELDDDACAKCNETSMQMEMDEQATAEEKP